MYTQRIKARLLFLIIAALPSTLTVAGRPETVGQPVDIELQSAHPYAAHSSSPGEWIVHSAGATYIRIHVSRLDLAPGDSLEIASPDDTQSFMYGARGPHGDGEFWANTIHGDTAVVRLHAGKGGAYGFSIDQFGRGVIPLLTPPPMSVCGTTDWQDAVCYDGGPDEAAWVRSGSAAHLLVGCCTQCTGFRVSDSGQYLTAHACVSDRQTVREVELTHRAGVETCGGPLLDRDFFVHGKRLLDTDPVLGFTLFSSEDYLGNHCLPLATQPPAVGDVIYIPHYPVDRARKLSIASDQSADGLCHVNQVTGSGIAYDCDTDAGSAGAPVISPDGQLVTALHTTSGCLGVGTRMDLIYARIASRLDPCAPVPATCGNGVIEAGEQCDGADLAGEDCVSRGFFGGGVLRCNGDCTFDVRECFSDCALSPHLCNCDGRCTPKEAQGGQCTDCLVDPPR